MRRILAIVMAAVMILSVAGTLIYYLTLPTFALDDEAAAAVDPAADREKLIRVGLMYGENVTVGFETVSPYGFFVSRVNRTGDLTQELIWKLDETKVSCIVDANLAKSGMTYSKTASANNAVVGGYHAELGMELIYEEVGGILEEIAPALAELDLAAFPAYIGGSYYIRVGHFATAEAAWTACTAMADAVGADWRVAEPSATGVALIDPLTDTLLFEYDDADVTALGLSARPAPDGAKAYLVTPAQKLYDGTFMFRRYTTDKVDGVSLTDIIPLGEYVKGVLPYEISSSWPYEAQRAFAICVRSFTLSYLNFHERAYQFDVCNNTHCQVYSGRARITDTVERAVDETSGLVMESGGKIVKAFYSAVAGGVTVGVDDAWGGPAQPHLVAVETPWELYTKHTNGVWQSEVSPTELCTYLRETKGYNLRGKIESIVIDQLAKNSTYIYQLTITDSYGSRVTIKTSDAIRLALGKYVNSANFVVGKGSVEAEVTTFTTVSPETLHVQDASGILAMLSGAIRVLGGSGVSAGDVSGASVLTGSGLFPLSGTSSVSETQVIRASKSGNFIFYGKGWGHGVGLSQVGVRDLAAAGVAAEDILPKYFTGIRIMDWRNI